MSGDFHFAGTGTVTWRHGNRILAFGHPFLQSGPTEMPMASAEILTVVQSVSRSFKLSNTGPIIGTIYQDRLTAIAGEIGRQAQHDAFRSAAGRAGRQDPPFSGRIVPEPDAVAHPFRNFAAGIALRHDGIGGKADDLPGHDAGNSRPRTGQAHGRRQRRRRPLRTGPA